MPGRWSIAVIAAAALAACGGAASPDRGAGPPPPLIPAAFVGVWNDDPATCHAGTSDTELRVTARALYFYASETEAARVRVHGPGAITVEGVAVEEGERRPARFAMSLSRAGNALTIDGFTRYKCPDNADPRPESIP